MSHDVMPHVTHHTSHVWRLTSHVTVVQRQRQQQQRIVPHFAADRRHKPAGGGRDQEIKARWRENAACEKVRQQRHAWMRANARRESEAQAYNSGGSMVGKDEPAT